jgi:L-lactate dehydrogenase complex protein LldE
MLTCLGDSLYGSVGIATVRVLEAVGCRVEFPENQTCCGQPPFNSGDWAASREIAAHCLSVFDPSVPIVTPSTSCAAMINHGYRQLFPHRAEFPVCYELSQFLVDVLQIESWPGRLKPQEVQVHVGCHGRAIGVAVQPSRLLSLVPGVDVVSFENQEQCCGFGGSFSTKHPFIGSEIGKEKLRTLGTVRTVSTDLGCLMHLQGLARFGEGVPQLCHIAEILAESLK